MAEKLYVCKNNTTLFVEFCCYNFVQSGKKTVVEIEFDYRLFVTGLGIKICGFVWGWYYIT